MSNAMAKMIGASVNRDRAGSPTCFTGSRLQFTDSFGLRNMPRTLSWNNVCIPMLNLYNQQQVEADPTVCDRNVACSDPMYCCDIDIEHGSLLYSLSNRVVTRSPGDSKPSVEEMKAQMSSSLLTQHRPLPGTLAEGVEEMNKWRAKTSAPHEPIFLNKITCFQGGSFYRVDENGLVKAVDRLALSSEQQILTDGVKQASENRVKLDFQKLTVGKLGASLCKKDSVLHFSTHGHSDRIAFEDEKRLGMEKDIRVEGIKDWFEKAARHVRLAFIDSCFTELLGELCVAAGIEHVIACRHDSSISDPAAICFAKIFWSTLASGEKTIQQAFDIALQETTQIHGAEEAKKFVLLPKDRNHNVKVVLPPPCGDLEVQTSDLPVLTSLPPRPKRLVGRETDMALLCEAIIQPAVRYVNVTGTSRVGKRSTVSEVVHYIEERRDYDAVNLNPVQWFPVGHDNIDSRHPCFQTIKDLNRIIADPTLSVRQFRDEKERICRDLDKALHLGLPTETTTLVVFEAVNMDAQEQADKLASFVEALLRQSHQIKVLVIHDESVSVAPKVLRWPFIIKPLDYRESLNLFEASLPPQVKFKKESCNVSSRRELVDFLFDKRIAHALHCTQCTQCSALAGILWRAQKMYAIVGNGFPSEVCDKACRVTEETLDALVTLRKEIDEVLPRYKSRAELCMKLRQLREERRKAADTRDCAKCIQIDAEMCKLVKQKESLKLLHELEKDLFVVNVDIATAFLHSHYKRAKALILKKNQLEVKISIEKAEEEAAISRGDCDILQLKSRCEMTFKIGQLTQQFAVACEVRNYDEARALRRKCSDLDTLLERMPTKEALTQLISQLEKDRKRAIAQMNEYALEVIDGYLDSIKKQLQLEIDEEARLYPDGVAQTQLRGEEVQDDRSVAASVDLEIAASVSNETGVGVPVSPEARRSSKRKKTGINLNASGEDSESLNGGWWRLNASSGSPNFKRTAKPMIL